MAYFMWSKNAAIRIDWNIRHRYLQTIQVESISDVQQWIGYDNDPSVKKRKRQMCCFC